jgi:methylase of polypeptide subunit release factors
LKGTLVKGTDVSGLIAKTDTAMVLATTGAVLRPRRPAMRRHPTAQESGTSPSEAERLRRMRLSVWEYEGGGLGPLGPPPGQRTEVAFDGVTILTAPGVVMTPRHTTEALVDWAVEWLGSRSMRVADVGTGSGAVAIAVALRARGAQIWATDDSESAVALARANVTRFGLEPRVRVLVGNLLEPVRGQLDLVLANLPYHAAARSRGPAASACRDQPEHAIYAPGDGLRFNRELIEACRTRLAAGGFLAIQLYGHVLSAGSGELDRLLAAIEARAAEGWEARVAAASAAGEHRRSMRQPSSVSEALAGEALEQPPRLDDKPRIAHARDSAQHLAVVARREPDGGPA